MDAVDSASALRTSFAKPTWLAGLMPSSEPKKTETSAHGDARSKENIAKANKWCDERGLMRVADA